MTRTIMGAPPAAAVTAGSLGLGTTDSPTFSAVNLGGVTPGSTLRFVGRKTTSGAPASGTFVTNDVMLDSAGLWWLCTAGGTPGTWSSFPTASALGLGTANSPQFTALSLSGVSPGSTMRFVGRNTSAGAPATGTWLLGDVLIDVNGVLWLCTTAGTPGTWSYAVPSHGSAHAPNGSDPALVALTAYTSSDQTTTSATAADITSLSLSVPTAGTYEFLFTMLWQSTTTTNGAAFTMKSSGAPSTSALGYHLHLQNTTTTQNWFAFTALGSSQGVGTAGSAGTSYTAEYRGHLVATSTGTLVPTIAIGGGTAGNTVTLKAGSWSRLDRVS
jgi:hypothetical protein